VRRYLLDATPLAALLFSRPTAVTLITPWITRGEAATSIVVYAEVTEYVRGFPSVPQRQAQLRMLLRGVHTYAVTHQIAERYADIRRQLRPPYGPGLIGDIDTLIAATALERNLTVVTTDSDFQCVPNLKLLLLPSRL
jgi:tRNA(fMet)-specific endonuclease VapC